MKFAAKTVSLDASQSRRFMVLLLLYALELSASLWLAYALRFDFLVAPNYQQERFFVFLWLVPLQLVLLGAFRQLNTLLAFFSTPDLVRMFQALSIPSLVPALFDGCRSVDQLRAKRKQRLAPAIGKK